MQVVTASCACEDGDLGVGVSVEVRQIQVGRDSEVLIHRQLTLVIVHVSAEDYVHRIAVEEIFPLSSQELAFMIAVVVTFEGFRFFHWSTEVDLAVEGLVSQDENPGHQFSASIGLL